MSFLLNKRKRDDSSNESLSLPNNDTSKNYQENNNNNEINMQEEEILNEENVNMNIDNSQKNNNKLDAFQMMFQSINSRKEDQNNNMILSPLCSNLFFGSFQKMKNYDKILGSNIKSGIVFSKSNSSFLKNRKGKMFFSPSSLEMENNFNFETFFNNNNTNNNNNEKMKINLDLDLFNVSEKKNIFEITNLENKLNEDNTNQINNDIFPLKSANNFFENIKNNPDNNFTFNSCYEKNNSEKKENSN